VTTFQMVCMSTMLMYLVFPQSSENRKSGCGTIKSSSRRHAE